MLLTNVKELCIRRFDETVSYALLSSLLCPSIESLALLIKPDEKSHKAHVRGKPWKDLPKLISTTYPKIKSLDMSKFPEKTPKLFEQLANTNHGRGGGWLLPHLKELTLRLDSPLDISRIVTRVRKRLLSGDTAFLRRIVFKFRTAEFKLLKLECFEVFMESQLRSLKMLVPEVAVETLISDDGWSNDDFL